MACLVVCCFLLFVNTRFRRKHDERKKSRLRAPRARSTRRCRADPWGVHGGQAGAPGALQDQPRRGLRDLQQARQAQRPAALPAIGSDDPSSSSPWAGVGRAAQGRQGRRVSHHLPPRGVPAVTPPCLSAPSLNAADPPGAPAPTTDSVPAATTSLSGQQTKMANNEVNKSP